MDPRTLAMIASSVALMAYLLSYFCSVLMGYAMNHGKDWNSELTTAQLALTSTSIVALITTFVFLAMSRV